MSLQGPVRLITSRMKIIKPIALALTIAALTAHPSFADKETPFVPATPSEKIVYGDANGDGMIGSADVILVKKYIANYDTKTGTSTVKIKGGADANGDGKIASDDVILLKKYIANYDPETKTSTVTLGKK